MDLPYLNKAVSLSHPPDYELQFAPKFSYRPKNKVFIQYEQANTLDWTIILRMWSTEAISERPHGPIQLFHERSRLDEDIALG